MRQQAATETTPADNDPPSFEEARLETLETGFLLACYQTLLIALRDRRLAYKHRAVLAVLIEHMNGQTGVTWIGRERIAVTLGIVAKTVSNAITDLMAFGYIIAENRRTPEANNRSLRHYTLRMSKEDIARELTRAIEAIKASGPTSKVPAGGEVESPHGRGISSPKSPPAGRESPHGRGTVTNDKELTSEVLADSAQTRAAALADSPPIDGEVTPARRKGRSTGKRPWAYVHESEKRALLEWCKEFAEARRWPPEFLADRLKAFAAFQSSRRIASADWQAELELWLGNAAHQPRANDGRASTDDLAAQAFGGGPWARS